MSRSHSRRSSQTALLLRFVLILLFAAVAIYAGYHCLFRAPQQSDQPVQNTVELSPEEEALKSHLERKPDFYTILVSGVDDHNGGSDTNILVAVDVANDSIYGVSIPRDTKAIINGKAHKINYAYNAGGTALMAETISDQLGIPVDYTVQVDLQGFVALVDAIGGVTFDVPVDMHYEDPYQNLYIHIDKGVQTLNGENAMKVVRFRSGYASTSTASSALPKSTTWATKTTSTVAASV